MTALASYPALFAVPAPDADIFEQEHLPSCPERICMVLSQDDGLIASIAAATERRCFQLCDYFDVEEAAVAALFAPPALAVLDLRLAYEPKQFKPFVALCRQLVTERTTYVALIGCADDEREEKLFRQLGATYYFPGLPSPEDLGQLAMNAADRVRVSQQDLTAELLCRAIGHVPLLIGIGEKESAA
jgi:hypothetical protein